MESFTPTTTRDILGLALLSTLSGQPLSRTAAVETVRALCLPWLTPTREVVECLVSEYCVARYLYVEGEGDPRTRSNGSRLWITPGGECELRDLALHRTGRPAHHLAILCESLRLSIAHRLDPRARAEILRAQLRARRRCLAMQHRRLAGAGSANPVLARVLRHQLACVEAEFEAIAKPSGGAVSPYGGIEVLMSTIAGAQAELDAPARESRTVGRDGSPPFPFPA